MTYIRGRPSQGYQHQPDAAISQNNPVSTTLYTVLGTTADAYIIGIACHITWAVTQPTPMEVVVTIDGQTLTYAVTNPVSGTAYTPSHEPYAAPASGVMYPAGDSAYRARPLFLMGRIVKIETRITWAVTQPTPLVCRVKWAKLP